MIHSLTGPGILNGPAIVQQHRALYWRNLSLLSSVLFLGGAYGCVSVVDWGSSLLSSDLCRWCIPTREGGFQAVGNKEGHTTSDQGACCTLLRGSLPNIPHNQVGSSLRFPLLPVSDQGPSLLVSLFVGKSWKLYLLLQSCRSPITAFGDPSNDDCGGGEVFLMMT